MNSHELAAKLLECPDVRVLIPKMSKSPCQVEILTRVTKTASTASNDVTDSISLFGESMFPIS